MHEKVYCGVKVFQLKIKVKHSRQNCALGICGGEKNKNKEEQINGITY